MTYFWPGQEGNRNVTLEQSGNETAIPLDEAAFERLQPLLDAMQGVGVSVAT